MNTNKITKSNAIINSSYRLSLNELRIVLFGLSHIDPTADDFPLFHRVCVKELAEFYNIGAKDRGSFYDNIKDALIRKFWERGFSFYDEERGAIVKRRWLIEVEYGRKDGTLAYHYNPLIKNELQQMAKKFTSYFLANVANMKSVYAVRLYEIAVMYLHASQQDKTTFTKNIEKLKNHLGLEKKYPRFNDFKRRVLESAKKEINKYSNIKFSYKVIRQGRTANEIEFTVSKREPKEYKEAKQLPLLKQDALKLSPSAIEKGKAIIKKAGTRWDIYAIEQQFYAYAKQKGIPENPTGAFLGFVKKKAAKAP